MKKFKLHAGTFDVNYWVVIGTDYEEIIKFIRLKMQDSACTYDFSESRGACFTKFNYTPVLWLPKKPRTPRDYATLNHEIFHMVFYILISWAGLKLNEASEEAFAHQIGKCTADILEKL